jgi:ABC-type Zn2+ transport system substrate-binding protein/surface adhesin
VRGVLRIVIVLLIATALPLRGFAAVAAELCADHHGGAQATHAAGHDHESGHEHESSHDSSGNDGEHHSTASICSYCASCSVGTSLAPDSAHPVAALVAGADRIPFFDARKPGYVPDQLDRPPLVS